MQGCPPRIYAVGSSKERRTNLATQEATLTGAGVREGHRPALHHGQAIMIRVFAWVDRAMLGGATPRSYRREGLPEIELHQIISGRKDRFDVR